MAILDALGRKRGFTKTEEDVADYVLAHPDQVATMNIGDLSKATFTSNATIVRLCRKLGVDGYREFRIALAGELERMRVSALDVNPDQPFFENQSTRDIMSSIASLTKQAVDGCYATLSGGEVQRAARLILGARRVAIYAIGDSCISAEGFSNLLLKIGITCFVANQFGDALAVSHALGPADVALVVTYSGDTLVSMGEELDVLRSRGCRTIVVTANEMVRERMAGLDCMLMLPNQETRQGRIATYYSQMCIRYALNCVYGECFAQNYRGNLEHRDRLEETHAYLA